MDTYGPNGWLTRRVTRPASSDTLTQWFTYDAAGNRTSITDPRGNRTDFCFDVDYAGSLISGGPANLTRQIDPAPTVGANRPVVLMKYDTANNLIQSVAPRGVPSGATVTCPTNLSAVNVMFATDLGFDATHVYLLSRTTRFSDPDTGAKTAVTKYEYGDAANLGLVTKTIPRAGIAGRAPTTPTRRRARTTQPEREPGCFVTLRTRSGT